MASPSGRRATVFVQAIPITPPPAGHVVALTPDVLEWARQTGLEVSVLDDHIDRRAVLPKVGSHQRWSVGWFARLDECLGLRGAAVASAQMAVSPVSAAVTAARLLAAVVRVLDPTEVLYVGPRGEAEDPWPLHHGHLQFWPRLGDAPLSSRLLPLIAADRNLGFRRMDTWADAVAAPRPPTRSALVELGRDVRRAWRLRTSPTSGERTLVTWMGGYGLGGVLARAGAAGQSVVFLDRGRSSTRILAPGRTRLRPLTPRIPVTVSRRWLPPPKEVEHLLSEVDTRADLHGVASAVAGRLGLFLAGIAPTVLEAADALAPWLERRGIQRVMSANPASVEEFAVLAAAGSLGIPRELYQHGDHLFPYDDWLVSELQNIDVLHASDRTMAADLKAAASMAGTRCPTVVTDSPRIEQLHARRPRREGPICYLPGFLVGDTGDLGVSNFDPAWYHRWHLRLLALMAGRPEEFLWKTFPPGDQVDDPLAALLRFGSGPPNVRLETSPFLTVADEVSAVFTDYPSTGLFEAVHLGLPVLGLWFDRFASTRPSVVAALGSVVRRCANEDDALAAVCDFLSSPRQGWVARREAIYPTTGLR